MLSDDHRSILLAVLDTLIPVEHEGDGPSPVHLRILDQMQKELAPGGERAELAPVLGKWLEGLMAESVTIYTCSFPEMHRSTRDEILDRVETENTRVDWGLSVLGTTPTEFFATLVDWVADIHLGKDAGMKDGG